ncbi:MAG: hypothetical protein ACYTBP_01845 [Planctomycetota bacterium]|jgi:hypothetical protein
MGNMKEPLKFSEIFHFPKIFQTFRLVIFHPGKLFLALLGLAVICFSGWIMDLNKTVVVTPDTNGRLTELQIYIDTPEKVGQYIKQYEGENEKRGVFSTLWEFAADRFQGSVDSLFELNFRQVAIHIAGYFKALGWALRFHFFYSILFSLITMAVLSITGGAICRITALQFSRGQKPGMLEALRFSCRKFMSFFLTPLLPVLIIMFLGCVIYLVAMLGALPWGLGELLIGIAIPGFIICGFAIAYVTIGGVMGFNLMFPAVAYDGSDFLDSMGRSFHYIYRKPWHMGFYSSVAAVYGSICYTFVRLFTFLLLFGTHQFLLWGIGVFDSEAPGKVQAIWPEPSFMNLIGSSSLESANLLQMIGPAIMRFFLLTVMGILVSFIISFYFTANTIIYSLMRNKVDNTALEEVYTHPDDLQNESYNLKTEQSASDSQ